MTHKIDVALSALPLSFPLTHNLYSAAWLLRLSYVFAFTYYVNCLLSYFVYVCRCVCVVWCVVSHECVVAYKYASLTIVLYIVASYHQIHSVGIEVRTVETASRMNENRKTTRNSYSFNHFWFFFVHLFFCFLVRSLLSMVQLKKTCELKKYCGIVWSKQKEKKIEKKGKKKENVQSNSVFKGLLFNSVK